MTTILEDYCAELVYAVQMKRNGVMTVPALTGCTNKDMSIDDYIQHWLSGIHAMAKGAPEDLFNY